MKIFHIIPLIGVLLMISITARGQSDKKMNKYLTQKWVSAGKINETDTTAMDYADETLHLKKDGELSMTGGGSTMAGTWEYDPDSGQLVMELKTMDGKDVTEMNMKVGLDILMAENQILTVSKQGKRTIIYVMEESEIKYE